MIKRKEIFITAAIIVFTAGLFLLLKGSQGDSFDLKVFRFLNGGTRNPLFDAVMPVITDFRKWRIVVLLVWSRMRPCEILGNVHLWYGKEGWITTPAQVVQSYKSSFSFPSSHAANITASMLFLGLVYRRALTFTLLFAALVSFSRIYIGVHWPLDVLGGIAIGSILGWTAFLLYRKIIQSVQDTRPSE